MFANAKSAILIIDSCLLLVNGPRHLINLPVLLLELQAHVAVVIQRLVGVLEAAIIQLRAGLGWWHGRQLVDVGLVPRVVERITEAADVVDCLRL